MTNEKQSTCSVLSLSGGGVRGLYTVSVLAELEKVVARKTGNDDFRIGSCFDLVCGTSIGGIIAIGLAKGMSAREIKAVLREQAPAIFKRPWWRRIPGVTEATQYLRSLYSPTPLRNTLYDLFGNATIGDLEMAPRLVVPAINITNGQLKIFKTPHHDELYTDHGFSLVDVGLATSAAPSYFPIHLIDDTHYIDGGVIVNSPAMMGVLEAHTYLGFDYQNIQLVAIGTMGSAATAAPEKRVNWGFKNWGPASSKLLLLSMSSTERLHNDMAKLYLKKTNSLFIDTPPEKGQAAILGLDEVSEAALNTLSSSGKGDAAKALGKSLLKQILGLDQLHKGQPISTQEVHQ